MSSYGGPTSRFESARASRTFQRLQDLIENKGANRIKNTWLLEGIANKEIPPSKNFYRGKWMYPAHPSIDIGRESKANLDENRQGAKSLATIYSEQGMDVDDELEQIAREQSKIKALAKKYDIEPTDIYLKTPNPPAIAAPENQDSADQGDNQSQQDQATTQTQTKKKRRVAAK
jgi:hypothetical protein